MSEDDDLDTTGAVSAYIEGETADVANMARASMASAVGTDGDFEARIRKQAAAVGVPISTARNMPQEVERRATLEGYDFDALAKEMPATMRYLADMDNARLAHDNVPNLTAIESRMGVWATAWNSVKRGFSGLQQVPFGMNLRAGASQLANFEAVEAKLARGETVLDSEDPTGLRFLKPADRAALRSKQLALIAANATTTAAFEAQKKTYPSPDVVQRVNQEKTLSGVVREFLTEPGKYLAAIGPESLVQNAPFLALGGVTGKVGGAALGATTMGAGSFVIDYSAALLQALGKAGVDTSDPQKLAEAAKDAKLMQRVAAQAYAHAAIVGTVDAVSGGVASKMALPSGLLSKSPAVKELANIAVQVPVQGTLGATGEVGGQIAAGQEISVADAFAEFVGEAFSSPADVAVLAGKRVQEVTSRATQQKQSSQQDTTALGDLLKMAEKDKLRERDPTAFAQVVQDSAEQHGAPPEVFIDARALVETLQQTGMTPEQIADALPSAKEQLPAALAAGGDVVIPVGQFTALVAGSGMEQQLLQHARTDIDGLSPADVEAVGKVDLAAEAEAAVAEQDRAGETKAVRAAVLDQLNAAGRFPAQVNAAYADSVMAIYETQAERMGVSVAEFAKQHPLTVQATAVSGASLNQADRVRPELLALVQANLDASGPQAKVAYREVSPEIVRAASGAGVDVAGYTHTVDSSAVRHILKNHGDAKKEAARGNLPVTGDDIAAIPEIIDNPDKVIFGLSGKTGLSLITYLKRMPDGTTLYLEEARTGRKELAATSLRKYPATTPDNSIIEALRHTRSKPASRGELSVIDRPAADNTLTQSPGAPKGSFAPSTNTITLLAKADLSSFHHELGHWYLEVLSDMASQPDAPATVAEDMGKLLEWFDWKGTAEEWRAQSLDARREAHEKFARGYEAYLFEGRSPSAAIGRVFQRFAAWMRQIYRSMRDLNVEINDDIRRVYDRMLASEDAIKQMEQIRAYTPLFSDAKKLEEAGVHPSEYHGLGADATAEAVDTMQGRGLRDMKWLTNAKNKALKELQKAGAEARKAVQAQVTEEVDALPIEKVRQFIAQQHTPPKDVQAAAKAWEATRAAQLELAREDVKTAAQAERPGLDLKKNRTALNQRVENKMLAWELKNPRPQQFEPVTDMGAIADAFGYQSGDQLQQELASEPLRKDRIDAMTDQRMLEQYGELNSPQAIERMAELAVHNEARGKFIATELAALDKGLGPMRVIIAAAKQFAAQVVGAKRVIDLKPAQYAAAETRAAKLAVKALGTDTGAAIEAKRSQVLNHYLFVEATRAIEEAEKARRYFTRVQEPGKIPASHHDQIAALLGKFDLRKSTSAGAIDNRARFSTWAKSQLEAGEIPPNFELLLSAPARRMYHDELLTRDEEGNLIHAEAEDQLKVAAEFLDAEPARSYKELTVEELRNLYEAVKQIEHMGRRTNAVLTAKDKRLFSDEVDRLKASIIDVATKRGRKASDARTPNTKRGKAKLSWRGFFFSHIKAANQINIMDGGMAGPMWERLIETSNDAGNKEVLEVGEYHDKVRALMDRLPDKGRFTDKPIHYAQIDESLNRNAILSMAMDWGNESNRQRLADGHGWTVQQIEAVFAQALSQDDWVFVQGMWDAYESLRPRVAEMELDIRGSEPDWITPLAFNMPTADGGVAVLRGGYAPVVYDPRASGKAMGYADEKQAKEMMQAARMAASVNRSFTKARVEEVHGRPLMLSLDGKINALTDTIHYLHWQRWIIDTNRFLKALDPVIREHYGHEVVKMLRDWAADNAAGVKPARDAAERKAQDLARNVSFVGLAFNLVSAASQVAGFTQSMVVLGDKGSALSGAGWLMRGLASSMASPRRAYTDALAKSEFMRKRSATRIRDIAEIAATVEGQSPLRQKFDRWGYAPMLAMQTAVDIPTWWGAYEKTMAETNGDEKRSVAVADQAVRDSQGGGSKNDLSSIERMNGAIRLLTGFMSFMNTTFNLNYRVLKSDANVGRKAMDLMLINVIPVMIGMAVKAILTPGDADSDEDSLLKRYLGQQFSYLFGQMVVIREFSQVGAALAGLPFTDYGGSVGTRAVADVIKLAKQVSQGEMDTPLVKAVIGVASDYFRLPGAQINRSIGGVEALMEDKTDNPAAVLFGYQEPR